MAALQELDQGPAPSLDVPQFNDKLHRTQAMLEETRTLMNSNLAEWISLPACNETGYASSREEVHRKMEEEE